MCQAIINQIRRSLFHFIEDFCSLLMRMMRTVEIKTIILRIMVMVTNVKIIWLRMMIIVTATGDRNHVEDRYDDSSDGIHRQDQVSLKLNFSTVIEEN